jgi:transcription initiation factor TFIIB
MPEHATETHHSRTVSNPSAAATAVGGKAICGDCGVTTVATDGDGTEYCQECGMVLSEVPIEQSQPSWTPREERRTGPSTSHLWLQKGTKIGDSGTTSRKSKILKRYNVRLKYSEKSLSMGLREIRSLAAALDIPSSTAERAAYIYRKTARADLLKGRSMDAIAAACVFIAARRNGPPLTFSWVAEASPVTESDISTAYRTLMGELNLTIQPPEPQEFLPRIASAVGVPHGVQRQARAFLQTAMDEGAHVGQSPPGVAGAALYRAARQHDIDATQESIATKAGVSPVTLSRQWQKLKDIIENETFE